MAGSWEEQPDLAITERTPYAVRRCPAGCQRYCRAGTVCKGHGAFGEAIHVSHGGRATHGHPPTSMGYAIVRLVPVDPWPSIEELREYEGPHD